MLHPVNAIDKATAVIAKRFRRINTIDAASASIQPTWAVREPCCAAQEPPEARTRGLPASIPLEPASRVPASAPRHEPSTQLSPVGHVTSAQRSTTHAPSRQSSPVMHITPAHGSVSQTPVETLQRKPLMQPLVRQLSSTQRPLASKGSQRVPVEQTTPSQAG